MHEACVGFRWWSVYGCSLECCGAHVHEVCVGFRWWSVYGRSLESCGAHFERPAGEGQDVDMVQTGLAAEPAGHSLQWAVHVTCLGSMVKLLIKDIHPYKHAVQPQMLSTFGQPFLRNMCLFAAIL